METNNNINFKLNVDMGNTVENTNKAIENLEKISKLKEQINKGESIKPLGGDTNDSTKFKTINEEIKALKKQAEELHKTWFEGGIRMGEYIPKLKQLETQMRALKTEMASLPVEFNNTSSFGALGALENHAKWFLGGAALAAALAVPMETLNQLRETEVLTLKIKQNLELAPQYQGNEGALNGDVQHLQNVAATFAMGYGVNLKDTMEMMQVLSRRFKSTEELTYYTNLAMVMHKLDFVEPKKAAEDLEAVILSMGLDFEGARRFIDEFSVAVHTARITGTELLTGLQRSGATFHQMNFNTAEAIALISTLSTVTAKAGANVGASLNSVLVNIDFKKAAQALKAYSIEVYDANGKMHDGVEVWRQIAQVFNGLDDQKANEFANSMSGGKFRANDLRALLSNWQTFEQILSDINEKASPEMTAKLLQTGLESLDTALKELTASLQVLGISLSEQALPAIKDMVIGLTQGVQWLNANKEAVGNVISVLVTLTELLLVYKANQLIANSATAKFVENMMLEIRTAPSVSAALAGMGSAFLGLARTIGVACLQLAAFQAMARIVSGASADTDEKSFLASIEGKEQLSPQEEEAKAAIDKRNTFIDENALLNGDNDYTGKWALYGSQTNQNESEHLDSLVRNKIAAANGLKDINAMVEEASKALAEKGKAAPFEYPGVGGQNIGNTPKGSGGSNGGTPSDFTERRKRIELQSELDKIFSDMKVSAENYGESLEILNAKEEVYGKTIENNANRYDLLMRRMKQMGSETDLLTQQKEKYQAQIDEYMEKDAEFKDAMGAEKPDFSGWSKEQKREFALENRNGFDDFKTLRKLLDLLNKTNEKIAETQKNSAKLVTTFSKDWLGDTQNADKQYSRRLNNIDTEGAGAKANISELDSFSSFKEAEIDIEQTNKKIKEMQDRYKYLAEEKAKATSPADQERLEDEMTKLKVKIDEAAKSIDKFKDKLSDVKKFWADSFIDMANHTKSLGDVGKDLFRQLQKDAIYCFLGIKHEASAASQMFNGLGKLGGGKGGIQGPSMANGSFYKNSGGKGGIGGKHATGGVVNVPSIAGEDGEEVIIPTEKNTQNSNALLDYASSKLGSNGTSQYVPYFKNQSLNSSPIINVEAQQNEALVAELKANNAMMKQQNHLLLNGDFGGGGGNNTVVTTGASTEQVLEILRKNPGALQNILGGNKNKGWR